MRTIHKYPIEIKYGPQVIKTLDGPFVHFNKAFDGNFYIWVEGNIAAPKRERHFAIVGTGHGIEPTYQHLATAIDDAFVWHLYETNFL